MFKHIAEINSATTVGTTLCAKRIAYSRFHPEIGNAKKILIIPSILVWIIGAWNLDIVLRLGSGW
jgi:hypothetical protein